MSAEKEHKMKLKKSLPIILLVAGVVLLIGAILILALAVPKADYAYKKVLGIVSGVLMLLITVLCVLYWFLSRDTYPNYFLFDRKKKRNIPVEKLKFTQVSDRMTFLLGQIADSPEALWKSDVLLHESERSWALPTPSRTPRPAPSKEMIPLTPITFSSGRRGIACGG